MKFISLGKKPLHWFSVFNLVIYMAVFTGRILRDAHLFTKPGGEKILPLVFILNAIIITWVGSRLDEWEKRLGKKKLFAIAFGGSAVFFFLSGFFFHPNPSEIFPFLKFIPVDNKWVSFVFYLISEIPIFLSMNIIWILAVDYFTEQQGQRDYPKVSSIGLIGIALASALALATQGLRIFPLYYLNFFWGFLSLFLWGISWGILRLCPKLSVLQESADAFTEGLEEEKEKPPPFWKTAWQDFTWIRKYPFLWLFTIVTVCNFLLLAIFDQTLANVSGHKGLSGTDLSVMLAKWILGFGIAAALFQWFGFPKLLKKKGVARTNLYAPLFMLIGALSYLLFASDFLEPIWASMDWDASKYLLEFVIGARIAGWIAEFLFNQSMLPFVYGAPPSQDGNRGRFFIEGPVTAITNGASGLFLLLYFGIFAQKDVGYGYKPDLLFVIAAFAAILMWIWSKRMIPHFKKVLKRRVLDGEGTDKLLSTYRPELVDDTAVFLDNVKTGKWDKSQSANQLRILGRTQGQKAVPILKNFAVDLGIPAENRAAAMHELIELNAVEAFDEIWKSFNQRKGVPAYVEIQALGKAGQHFGRTGDLKEKFNDWLNSENLDKHQIKELLRNLGAIGLDGALIVSEFINKHSENLSEMAHQKESPQPQEFSQMDLYLIAAELGSDRFYPKLSQVAREKGLEDWRALSQIEFYDHKNVLDAFALLLDQVEDIEDGASSALIKILRNHSWLVWPLLWILELPFKKIPETMHGNRHVWPLLLVKTLPKKNRKNVGSADFPLSSIHFFEQLTDKISESCAVEFKGIDW